MDVVDYTEVCKSEFPVIKSIAKEALRYCSVTMEQYEDYVSMLKQNNKELMEHTR